MNTELKTNKHYIIQTNSICTIKKIQVLEVTNTTYLIIDLDNLQANKERLLIEDFNKKFTIIEEIDKPSFKKSSDYYNLKWTPFGPTLD